jgi:alanyl-tRNA synthetase
MQPLVPYLMGESHPSGSKRLVDSQPSIRTIDIDEVGDNRHLTFFEMLGNWSLGDYFKKEQLPWIFDFFRKELGLSQKKLWVTVFEGNSQVLKDDESAEIWKKLGIPESRIFQYGAEKNWWSRSGTPEQMPVGEIGGPDSEIFYDFGEGLKLHEKSEFKNEECHPNCECGRFLEIGNSVFIQYKKVGENDLQELPQKNVDFGGGLERIAAAVNGNHDIFKTDLFFPVIEKLQENTGEKYEGLNNIRDMRIISDHIKASVFLVANGVTPSNKGQGYILRRLLRRLVVKTQKLKGNIGSPVDDITYAALCNSVLVTYKDTFLDFQDRREEIIKVIAIERDKFGATLSKGLKEIEKIDKIDAVKAFNLYQTFGFPLEITSELFQEKGQKINFEEYKKEFERHQELSRSTSAGVFKGGLADHSPEVIKLHTATHLLLASLRKVLGDQVVQKGQNITKERSRFDFPKTEKLNENEISKVEDIINEVIEKNLPVNFKILPKDEALKTGAIHAFNEKYADTVKVYFVGNSLEDAFSKEFCGGPHVTHTGEIGRVRIKKQEKIGANLVRIYLTAENG